MRVWHRLRSLLFILGLAGLGVACSTGGGSASTARPGPRRTTYAPSPAAATAASATSITAPRLDLALAPGGATTFVGPASVSTASPGSVLGMYGFEKPGTSTPLCARLTSVGMRVLWLKRSSPKRSRK